ncbi:MAG: hypothetical protein SO206_05250 [Bacilli bacterium]|nr:hypothetical protein [Erysipelotrichaceae bacterium]MDY4819631.1 hypothetical protein [Bacilli bacterium]
MACFLVSATVGIGTAVARHIVKHHEKKLELEGKTQLPEKFGSDIKWSQKLSYLELTLFSGSFLLAIEHILHGEVVPFPPFLTAASNPADLAEMLTEMGTVGVAMLAILLVAWGVGVLIADYFKFKKRKKGLKEAVVK